MSILLLKDVIYVAKKLNIAICVQIHHIVMFVNIIILQSNKNVYIWDA
jgi:hypothetical protein